MIKRYYEIHFDYSNEFKNTSVSVKYRKSDVELHC